MSVSVDIANAVASHLGGIVFSQPTSVNRHYQPAFDLDALEVAQIAVVPRRLAIEAASRTDDFFDVAVDVGVQAKVGASDSDEIDLDALDALMTLVEEICDALRRATLVGAAEASWISIENDPTYAAEVLETKRVFLSVLTITYRMQR